MDASKESLLQNARANLQRLMWIDASSAEIAATEREIKRLEIEARTTPENPTPHKAPLALEVARPRATGANRALVSDPTRPGRA